MNKYLTEIEKFLDLYFGKKAPAMPESAKEVLVKYSPYLSLIVLIISVPTLLFAFGLSAALVPFTYYAGYHPLFSFSFYGLFSLISMIFSAIAIPGLFKRTHQAWQYMFYASLTSLLSSLLKPDFASLIIGGALSFWILFQVKSYYKN